jgi:transcription elongation factor Elf1
MQELEKFFRCPYCSEKVSVLIDLSVEENQKEKLFFL